MRRRRRAFAISCHIRHYYANIDATIAREPHTPYAIVCYAMLPLLMMIHGD